MSQSLGLMESQMDYMIKFLGLSHSGLAVYILSTLPFSVQVPISCMVSQCLGLARHAHYLGVPMGLV